MRKAQAGDFTAFEELVGRLQPRVYGLANRILGETHDAEDVTQQTFLSLVEHMDAFRGESAVAGWVLRIAANHPSSCFANAAGCRPCSWPMPTRATPTYHTRITSPRGGTRR
jgi:hypothetical protein